MKKKGLLISTIVMVVVLVASLTTATYAWFTTDAKTSIEGFDVSVTNNSVLDIGLKINSGDYNKADNVLSYVTGDCSFSAVDGKLDGTWAGVSGMSSSINPQIQFSEITKAVGVTRFITELVGSGDSVTTEGWNSTTGKLDYPNLLKVNSADQNVFGFAKQDKSDDSTPVTLTTAYGGYALSGNYIFKALGNSTSLSGVELAVANGKPAESDNAAVSGDFAYMHLGIRPTKTVEENTHSMYIVVHSTHDSVVGLAAALHVAYRTTPYHDSNTAPVTSEWQDIDVFGTYTLDTLATVAKITKQSDENANKETTNHGVLPAVVFEMAREEFNITSETEITNAQALPIDLGEGTINQISEIEFVIYVSGQDSDCINEAIKNGTIQIGIFFGAQEKQTAQGN